MVLCQSYAKFNHNVSRRAPRLHTTHMQAINSFAQQLAADYMLSVVDLYVIKDTYTMKTGDYYAIDLVFHHPCFSE
jgi:hypothetical protein